MPRFQIIIVTQPLHLLSRIPRSFLSAKLLNWEVNMYTTSYKTCPFKGIDTKWNCRPNSGAYENSACESAVVPTLLSWRNLTRFTVIPLTTNCINNNWQYINQKRDHKHQKILFLNILLCANNILIKCPKLLNIWTVNYTLLTRIPT